MKLITSICFIAVMLSASGQAPSADAMRVDIEALRREIIPAIGTTMADVKAVYGVGEDITELKGKGAPSNYPMHTYNLLSPKPGHKYNKATLNVTYRNGKVHHIGIKHSGVDSNRVSIILDPKREIALENVVVLADLREIRQKYVDALTKASWNKNPNKP